MAWLTQDDVSTYGSDLIDVVQRGALNAVAPHLQNLEEQNDLLRQKLAVEARHRLDQQVAAAVPQFREIDEMPAWHSWLLGVDSLSGRQRQSLLDESIRSGNAGRTISFFRQFMREAGAAGGAPSASYGRARPSSGAVYTRAQVKQLYEHHRRGAYAGREQEWARIDADIIRAGAEGRILNPDNVTK